MTSYRAQAYVDAPLEEVWALVGNPAAYPEWWPGLALIDPEIQVEHRGVVPELVGRDFQGHEGVGEVMATVLAEFSEFETRVEEIIDAGDDVVVISFQRGVGRISGAEVEKRLPQVWTVRDGRVVRWLIVRKREEALRAAGLPALPPGGSSR